MPQMPLKERIRWSVGVPLRRSVPTGLKPALRTMAGWLDPIRKARFRRRTGYDRPIPPRELRANIGEPDIGRFISYGEMTLDYVTEAVAAGGGDLIEAERVLDFGCGAGRLLIPLLERRKGAGDLVGSDVNLPAIDWLKSNLGPGARAVPNDFYPPLPFDAGSFDVVYSVSIFTHLDLPSQVRWLAEIERVVAPGGLAVITAHGDSTYVSFREGRQTGISKDLLARLNAHGALEHEQFVFEPYSTGENTHSGLTGPYGLSFQTEEQVRTEWTRGGFEVAAYLPGLLFGHQDAVVLKKQAA